MPKCQTLNVKQAAQIKELLLRKGTIVSAAEHISVNKGEISRILSRDRSLSPERALKLYDYLGRPDELAYLKDYPSSSAFLDSITDQWTTLYFTYLEKLRELNPQFLQLPMDERTRVLGQLEEIIHECQTPSSSL